MGSVAPPGMVSLAAPAMIVAPTEVGLGEFGAILRRRWRLVLATTLAVTALGAAYAFLTKPIYSASTSIFVDPRNRASFQIEGTGIGGAYDPNLVDSQVVLIESDTVLRRVIEAEKLLDDPEFTAGPAEPLPNALRNLKDAIKVKRPDKTYVVDVEVKTRSPEKSARLANAMARAFLNDGSDSKSETARREGNWLETHINNLQARLKDAENRVEAFKAENKLVGVDGRLVGEQRLMELNRSLVEVQRRTSEAKATLDQVEQIRKTGRIPDSTGDALRSTAIERLRTQIAEILRLDANTRSTLGPRHPAAIEIREQLVQARQALNEELNRIADGAKNTYNVAKANEAALEKQLDALKRDATSTNQLLVRLRELERAVEAQRAVYQKFLSDKEQIARLTVDTPAGRVIAPAVISPGRVFPNKLLVLALAFVGGLFTGMAAALIAETLAQAKRPAARANRTMPARAMAPMPAFASLANDTEEPPARELIFAQLPAIAPARRMRWLTNAKSGATNTVSMADPDLARLDLVRREPNSDYSREIDKFAQEIAGMMGMAGTARLTLLVTAQQAGAGTSTFVSNLAFALAARGLVTVMVDSNPGGTSLSARLRHVEQALPIGVVGHRQWVLAPDPANPAGPFLLPFGGLAKRPSGLAGSGRHESQIILIDGPAMPSPHFAKLDLGAGIDGVLVVLAGQGHNDAGAIASELQPAFGELLLGAVARAA